MKLVRRLREKQLSDVEGSKAGTYMKKRCLGDKHLGSAKPKKKTGLIPI